ncbi:hypothetical protein [Maribacter sp. 2304DJ31-5]|uniref:hypothetical protein n=1 Tax=Maribacter sp. 2304DJ31-5 TaxID=3386273 RepID=UPI0039BC41A7
MDKLLAELEDYFEYRDVKSNTVSKVDVIWHLYHSLKTINVICEGLLRSNPKDYKSKINFVRIFVLTTGIIPRGKAKAPKFVIPPSYVETNELYELLSEAKNNLKKIEPLAANANCGHPYFDMINKAQAKKFLRIHTKHHIKIIKDILREHSLKRF